MRLNNLPPLFKRKETKKEGQKESLFGVKKGEEVVKKTILVEPFEVQIEETEEAQGDGDKWSVKRKGLLKVVNLSDSDLHTIEITLSKKLPGIGDKVKIPYLGSKEEWVKEFEMKSSNPSISVKRRIYSSTGKIIPIGKSVEVNLEVNVKNQLEKPLKEVGIQINIPRTSTVVTHSERELMFSSGSGFIKLSSKDFKPRAEGYFNGKISITEAKEDIEMGELTATYYLEDSISEISVIEAKAKSIVDTNVVVDQSPSDPNEWLAVIELSNPNNYAIVVFGEIGVRGEIKKDYSFPEGTQLEGNRIKLIDMKIKGLGKVKIGPIPIISEEMPSVEVHSSGVVLGKEKKESKGIIKMPPEKLKTLGAVVKKGIEVIVDESFSKLLGKGEIPSVIVSEAKIVTKAKILGNVNPEKISFLEELPEIVKDVKSVSIMIDGKKPRENQVTHEISGNSLRASVNLSGSPKEIELSYVASLDGSSSRAPILEFPSKVLLHAGGEEIEFTMSPMDIPKLKIKKMRANISASHKIERASEPNTFKATILLENKGNAPVLNKTITVELPPNIEVIDTQPNASISSKKNSTELQWKIDRIMPNTKIALVYTVKGSGEYSLDEIKKFKIA